MLYRIEFRLDHLPDPIEFDMSLPRQPSEEDVLSAVLKKLKPHDPAPSIDAGSVRDKLMADNGIVTMTLFDEKGVPLFVL